MIEGHDTRPRDIERAVFGELERETDRRNLQLEARAHLRVQSTIDEKFVAGELGEPAQPDFIRWLHAQFYADAPESALQIQTSKGAFSMQPGQFRSRSEHDNVVGRHVPPSSHAVPAFMDYFARRFCLDDRGAAARVVAIAIAHHRFNYIHPFPDGNGRVSRLLAHAMALKVGIGAHGLWSISRGLARGLSDRGEYKRMMDAADEPPRSDLDGRGNLSLRALEEFALWFLDVALDQLRFMSELFDLDTLASRLETHVTRDLGLSAAAAALSRTLLKQGEMPRGEARLVAGTSERAARLHLSRLIDAGLVASDTPKGPVSLRFSSLSAETLFPRLFPAQA